MPDNALHHPSTDRLQVAVFAFEAASLDSLEQAARAVAPHGRLREPGLYLERYRAHLAGRALLKRLLEGIGSPLKVMADPQYGFLRLSGPSPWGVNVSHTGSIAAAVLGPGSVGIDLERTARNADRAVKRVSTPDEVDCARQHFAGQAITPTIAVWSAKEAISKATGLGISFGMRAFHVDFQASEPFPVRLDITGPLPLKDPVVRMLFWNGCVISVCAERSALREPPSLTVVTAGVQT